MCKNVKIEVGGVSITLTPEQLAEIEKQRKKPEFDYRDMKSWNDILCHLDRSRELPEGYLNWVTYFNDIRLNKQEAAYRKLTWVANVLNGDWKPNYSNNNQAKYYPYFKYEDGTFSYDCWNVYISYSYVGARLSYKSAKLAEYAAKQFIDIYNDFLKP